jgi:hypothetical protein
MPYDLKYNAELGIIEGRVEGEFTAQNIRDWSIAAAQLAEEQACDLYLHDFRQGRVKLSTLEIHQLPEILAEIFTAHGMDIHRVKRALVVNRDIEDYRFFENVASNRGQPVRVFTDIDEATRWLIGPRADPSPPGG